MKPEAKKSALHTDQSIDDLDQHFSGQKALQKEKQAQVKRPAQPRVQKLIQQKNYRVEVPEPQKAPTQLPDDPTPKTMDFDTALVEDLKDLPEGAQFSKEQMKVLRGLAKDIDKTLNDLDVESEKEDIGDGEHLTEKELNEARSDVMDAETPEEDIEPEE